MKKITLLFLIFSTICFSQTTYVPDNDFEQVLIDLGYDSVLDNYVDTSNINTITALNLNAENISDLTGIEDFVALNALNCSDNYITNLDLSQNTLLTQLRCEYNNLINLNVKNGNNTGFTNFDASGNPNLVCITVDSQSYSKTNWTAIDPQTKFNTNCDNRTYIPDDNFEQVLINLGYDNILDNSVSTSDVNAISTLNVNGEEIKSLIGIEGFTALTSLNCSNNALTHLDVSKNTLLKQLNCTNNTLVNLNVKNGNNINFTFFDARGNPDLTCIKVNSPSWSDTNWTNIDTQSSFSLNCERQTYMPDTNFKFELYNLGYIGYPTTDYFPTASIVNITGLDLLTVGVGNYTGIEDFISLKSVKWGANASFADDPDLTQNTKLENLEFDWGSVYSIDLTQNTKLETFIIDFNQLTSIDLSHNTNLTSLSVRSNNIANLDVSHNTLLTEINCSSNDLASLDVSNCTFLNILHASSNIYLNTIDLTQNTSLVDLNLASNNFSALDLTNNPLLTTLSVSTNNLTELILNHQPVLSTLSCGNNNISTLSFNSTVLTELLCFNNQISNLDLSNQTELTVLECYLNNLSDLKLSNNGALTTLACQSNNLTSLDVSNNTVLTDLNCNSNSGLTTLNVKNGNNTNFTIFEAQYTNLYCIEVDDAAYSTTYWTVIGPYTSFSENCGPGNNTCFRSETITVTDTPITINFDLSDALITNNVGCNGTTEDYIEVWYNFKLPKGSVFVNGNSNINNFSLHQACASSQLTCFNNQGTIDGLSPVHTYSLRVFRSSVYADDETNTSFTIHSAETLNTNSSNLEYSISTYPNPVSNQLIVSTKIDGRFSIINVNGQNLKQGGLINGENKIEMLQLKAGLYFLKIETENGSILKKIIKK